MGRKKILLITVISIVLSVLVTGCSSGNSSAATDQTSGSKELVYEFYDKVQLNQTKDQVDTELGVTPTESEQMEGCYGYVNQDSGFGVDVVYDENGLAYSKTLFYPDREDIAFMTTEKVTQEQADSIGNGLTYDEAVNMLGCEGTETSATEIAFDDNKVSYIRAWVNQDGSMLQIVFLTDGTSSGAMFFDQDQ